VEWYFVIAVYECQLTEPASSYVIKDKNS